MIYNSSTVIDSAESLVGFSALDGFSLPTSLTSTTLKMNSYHPLLQLDVIDNVRPESQNLSDFLVSVRRSSISTLLNDIFTKKLAHQSLKTKLAETNVFDSTARFSNLINKRGRFLGWVFRPSKSNNLHHKITKIGIQLLQNETALPIYVYHSSQKDPLQTVSLTTTGAPSVFWQTLETPITMNYQDYDYGGFYFIGYYEDDLTEANRAIYKDYDLSVEPCNSCNPFNIRAYRDWSKYVSIATAYVDSTKLDGTDMVSVEDVEIENENNWGLNFRIESYCDLTSWLVDNIGLIAPALQVRYAIDLLRYLEMSGLRKNSVTDSMKEEAFVAINGQKSENNYVKVRGLIHDYEDYIKGLNFDLSRLDPVCLPNSYRSIKFR